jgi:hypothetical protein
MPFLTVEGTNEALMWRTVPAPGNEEADPSGAWLVLGGPVDDDPDICVEVTAAEHPKAVAEFLANAAQRWARQEAFSAAISDVQQARSAAGGVLPDMLWVAQLAEHVGKIAGEFSAAARAGDRSERARRVYEAAASLASCSLAWMEAHPAQARGDDSGHGVRG